MTTMGLETVDFDRDILKLSGTISRILSQKPSGQITIPDFLQTPSSITLTDGPLISKKLGILCRKCNTFLKSRATYNHHIHTCKGH